MTIAELIKELKRFPADMRVILDGYEGGYHDVSGCKVMGIKLNHYEEWYYGPHEDVSHFPTYPDKVQPEPDEQALHIHP